MAQIVLIKDANTIYKDVNDLVIVRDDDHVWSERELEAFTIKKIPGFTRAELETWLKNHVWIQTTSVWKAKTLEWTLEESENRKAWKDYDGKWYFYDFRVKYPYTFKNVIQAQWDVLESSTATRLQKELALSGVQSKIKLRPENQTEITDINKVVVQL